MRMKDIVFDRKTGAVGVKRLSTKKEKEQFHTNYVVDILDPIYLTLLSTPTERAYLRLIEGLAEPEHDWMGLPHTDARYQFYNLFDILEGGTADWEIEVNAGDHAYEINGQSVNNPHLVFKLIKGLFK